MRTPAARWRSSPGRAAARRSRSFRRRSSIHRRPAAPEAHRERAAAAAGAGTRRRVGTGGATARAARPAPAARRHRRHARRGRHAAIPTQCTSALPAGAQAADVSRPTTVVGTGTAASCTFAALNAAVTKGGVITFNCGAAPVTIAVTATMKLPTGADTVIDGGNRITLDGQNAVQILSFNHGDFMVNNTRVTLQHLTLVNGKTTPTAADPDRAGALLAGLERRPGRRALHARRQPDRHRLHVLAQPGRAAGPGHRAAAPSTSSAARTA